jgi:hypothetical protein
MGSLVNDLPNATYDRIDQRVWPRAHAYLKENKMTDNYRKSLVVGVYIFIALVLSLFIYTYSCQAAPEPLIPKPGDFIELPARPNAMLYYSAIPLTTQRFVTYGRLTQSKGQTSPDLSDQTKVVQKARDVRDKLLLVRNLKGFFALQVVVVQHSSVTIVKEPAVPWNEILPEIEKILSALEN